MSRIEIYAETDIVNKFKELFEESIDLIIDFESPSQEIIVFNEDKLENAKHELFYKVKSMHEIYNAKVFCSFLATNTRE